MSGNVKTVAFNTRKEEVLTEWENETIPDRVRVDSDVLKFLYVQLSDLFMIEIVLVIQINSFSKDQEFNYVLIRSFFYAQVVTS